MSKEAMIPFGLALQSYVKGNKRSKIIYHRDDGQQTEDAIEGYFREYTNFSKREKIALDNCKGKVLDLGAGVGPHSLELQKRGYEVIALDISERACDIMRKRGINIVRCKSVYEINDSEFDTILSLGCSIAFVENLKGLEKFLNHAKTLLNKNGIILMDSRDVRITNNPKHIEYQENNIDQGKYRGEIRLQIEYNGKIGEKFQILHVDPDILEKIAKKIGFTSKILSKNKEGLYLIKLMK
jgi:SAM-dependent methyltransferase